MILSQASEQVLQVLPSLPPSSTRKYEGTQQTAAIRAATKKTLDDWKPGQVNFPRQHAPVDLSRSDTRSFGETHANELSTIGTPTSNQSGGTTLHDPPFPVPAPAPSEPEPTSSKLATSPTVSSAPLQPGSLNLTPVRLPTPQIPSSDSTTMPQASGSDPIDSPAKFPQVTPTVAETGVPKSAGPDGPGPASGSLLEVKAEHSSQGGPPGSTSKPYESAEDEKKRLARERALEQGPSTPAPKFETAEEEKRRLERERVAGGSSTNPAPDSGKPDEEEDQLPPYKEF